MAFELPIEHLSRHVTFGGSSGDGDIELMGEDWSSAAFRMTFSASKGGSAISGLTLSAATAGTQGISATYDAGYIHPDTGAIVGATTIRPQIDEASFEALSWGSDPAAPLILYYDLLVTPAGQTQQVFCFGTFTIQPGVGD